MYLNDARQDVKRRLRNCHRTQQVLDSAIVRARRELHEASRDSLDPEEPRAIQRHLHERRETRALVTHTTDVLSRIRSTLARMR